MAPGDCDTPVAMSGFAFPIDDNVVDSMLFPIRVFHAKQKKIKPFEVPGQWPNQIDLESCQKGWTKDDVAIEVALPAPMMMTLGDWDIVIEIQV